MSAFTFLDGAFLAATQVSGEQTVNVAIVGSPMTMAAVLTQPATVDVAVTGLPMTMAAALSSGGDADADADAYIARLTGSYSSGELAALDAMFVDLKALSLASGGNAYNAIAALWLFWLANSADALLNIKSSSYSITTVGSPTFTAREGWKLSGSGQYLRTGLNPRTVSNTQPGWYQVYKRLNLAQNSKYDFCAFDGTNFIWQEERNTSDRIASVINRVTGFAQITTSNGQGCVSAYRGNNTTGRVLQNQGTAGTATLTGTTPPDTELWIGAFHNSGVLDSGFESSNQFGQAIAAPGAVLTDAEVRSVHAIIEACADAFGAGVVP